jgi:hypothetical protein
LFRAFFPTVPPNTLNAQVSRIFPRNLGVFARGWRGKAAQYVL